MIDRPTIAKIMDATKIEEVVSEFVTLKKRVTVEGYFKPEEWQDAEGVKHNRVILVATKFYEAVEIPFLPCQRLYLVFQYLFFMLRPPQLLFRFLYFLIECFQLFIHKRLSSFLGMSTYILLGSPKEDSRL